MNKDNLPSKKPRRRRSSKPQQNTATHPPLAGATGGQYQPLKPDDLSQIDRAARTILADIGIAEAPEIVIEHVTRGGGWLDDNARLHFSLPLIEQALSGLVRGFTLCGRNPAHDLQLSPGKVYVGSGGAAPLILDMDSGEYRDSTLSDLYDAARVVDTLEHIHFFSRSLVARDISDLHTLDVNTAYTCLAGTDKHVFTSASTARSVSDIAAMCYAIAGSRTAFLERPFLSLNCNMSVPPLRFDAESCEVAAEAVRYGIPLHSNTFGQMGASSPVTLAGSVAQTVAESLAGMIFGWLIDPAAKLIFGPRPMLTDLRTGAMSGGSAEGALATAACIQMANYYSLPNSVIAGATDSKLADAQSGYEKSLTVTLAAQAGCNLITQASGMQASLMGCALESYVIDNDMLGLIMKSLTGIEVNTETLALESINAVVHDEGHFLGRNETLARMNSDFLYPQLGDRRSVEEWQAAGRKDIRAVALEQTKAILRTHYPRYILAETDAGLRERFDIRLPVPAQTMGTITNSSFQPAWWLRSNHLQTIWPSLFRKRPDFTPQWERVELDDGDFMDLAWHRRPEADAPIVMLIHGLEGSLQSHYAGNLLVTLHENGYTAILLHLRGRGREPNRLSQSYHSGATGDLRLILNHLAKQQQTPAAVIGISLGGNLLLKYLGEAGADSPLKTAVAASVPFSLQACATQLESGLSKIYGRYLLNLLKQSYRAKFSRIQSPLTLDPDLKDIQTLQQFDNAITAPLHGFNSAADYYQRCSCAQFLNTIHTPTLIIHARDDPFMRPDVVPEAAAMSAAVTLELTRHGGHVGFITGRSLFGLDYWLEQRIIEHLRTVL